MNLCKAFIVCTDEYHDSGIHIHACCSCNALRITCRALLLALLATCRGVYVFIEQPSSSVMKHFPYLTWMQRVIGQYVTKWHDQF